MTTFRLISYIGWSMARIYDVWFSIPYGDELNNEKCYSQEERHTPRKDVDCADHALLSSSDRNLQRKTSDMEIIVARTRLTINTKKTKIMAVKTNIT